MTSPVLSISTEFGRYYVHPTRQSRVPSVTNIKDKKAIKALTYWAAKEAAQYASDNIAKLATLKPDEIFTLVKSAPFAKTSAKEESSRVGDVVHGWVDRHIKGERISQAEIADPFFTDLNGKQEPLTKSGARTAQNMWRQFGAIVKTYNPKWVASEFTVWSDTHGYAGTADWAARIAGALVLGDTKTGKQAYEDTAVQLAALANADVILMPDGTERPLPHFDKFAVMHLRPTFARLIPYEHIDEAFIEFLGLKAVFDFEVKYKDQIMMFAPKIQAPPKSTSK